MASDFNFYQKLFSKLSDGLEAYWTGVASDIASAITPVATTMISIYVMLWGWSMMRGVIQEPITDGVGRIVRLSLIFAIGLKMSYYSGFLADMLWNSPDALAAIVASGHSDGNSNMQFLDNLMAQFYDMGQAYNDRAVADSGVTGLPDLSLWATAIAIWLSGLLVTGYAAFLFALSKMALAILLGVGGLFVIGVIFEPTKRFFDAWLGQALNFVFLVMLTSGAVKLVMTIIKTYLSSPETATAMSDPSINQALPAIVFSVIGFLVMMQLPSIASALGGGTAIGTLGAVGWAYGRAKGGMSAMRPTNLRRAANKAKSDVRIATAAAKSVAGAPGAIYRRITGGSRNRVQRG